MTSGPLSQGSDGPIGIYGGTFDPIHLAHLRVALEVHEALGLTQVRFVLAARPPHRDAPETPAALRFRMLEAAIAGEPRFVADRREFERAGPSYTVDTLASLAEEFPGRNLCLLLGMDAFLGLPKWHRWGEVLERAHIVVAHRPGWEAEADGVLGDVVRERLTTSPTDLITSRAGRLYVQPVTQLDISATGLRAAVRRGKDPRYLVPDAVRRIILETECYAHRETEPAER